MKDITCKLDWLTFTWKSSDIFNSNELDLFLQQFPEIEKIMHESVIIKDGKGSRGNWYDHVLAFNDFFNLSFSRSPLSGEQESRNLGVCVSVPAHGLEYFFDKFGYKLDQAVVLLEELYNRGVNFSRLDLAYDDYNMFLLPDDFNVWNANKVMVSNMKYRKYEGHNGSRGTTFYLGKRDNGKLLRIYDKDYESKGEIPAVRYEFEFHSKYTPSVISFILNNNRIPTLSEMLDNFILFISDTPGEQRALGKPIKEWLDFKDCINAGFNAQVPLKATASRDTKNLYIRSFRWYKKQIFKRMYAIAEVVGKDRFYEMMEACQDPETNDYLAYYWHTHKKDLEYMLMCDDWIDQIERCS